MKALRRYPSLATTLFHALPLLVASSLAGQAVASSSKSPLDDDLVALHFESDVVVDHRDEPPSPHWVAFSMANGSYCRAQLRAWTSGPRGRLQASLQDLACADHVTVPAELWLVDSTTRSGTMDFCHFLDVPHRRCLSHRIPAHEQILAKAAAPRIASR